jgi:hypothetical protein
LSIYDEEVTRRLSFNSYKFNPSSINIQLEDIPLGYIIGVYYESDTEITDDSPWIIHLAPPPFAMRVCDLTNEDLAPEDIWASLDDGNVLGHLQWLTNLSCERNDLRVRAEIAAEMAGPEEPRPQSPYGDRSYEERVYEEVDRAKQAQQHRRRLVTSYPTSAYHLSTE